MSAHTPGSWTAEDGFIEALSGDAHIATMEDWPDEEQEQEANARLIAAAPLLLASAQGKLADCREHGECATLLPDEYCSKECIDLAEAVAKATGDSQ